MISSLDGPSAIFLGACLLLLAVPAVRKGSARTLSNRVLFVLGFVIAAGGCIVYAISASRSTTTMAATAVIFLSAAIYLIIPARNSTRNGVDDRTRGEPATGA